MIEGTSSIGNFAKLPYEVREQIWQEFAPSGQDPFIQYQPKRDLSILCTSRLLHDEISRIIYLDSRLEFNISSLRPLEESSTEPRTTSWTTSWTSVYFSNRHIVKTYREDTRPRWYLHSLSDTKSRGFHRLPFHRVENVVVKLGAPGEDTCKVFQLWEKVNELVKLFKEASKIPNLTIQLRKQNGHDWGDWFQRRGTERWDHDVVVIPFCTIQNLEDFHVEGYSKELEDSMDWELLNLALRTVQKRSSNPSVSSRYEPCLEEEEIDIDRLLAEDFFMLYTEVWDGWSWGVTSIAESLRRSWTRQWICQEFQGFSRWETQILYIINTYPDIVVTYDPGLKILKHIHVVLVCLYHHVQFCKGNNRWGLCNYCSGCLPYIPKRCTFRYREKIMPLIDDQIYASYAGKEGFKFPHRLDQ